MDNKENPTENENENPKTLDNKEEIDLDIPKEQKDETTSKKVKTEESARSAEVEEDTVNEGDEEMIEPYIEKTLENATEKPKHGKKRFAFNRTTGLLAVMLLVVASASFVWIKGNGESNSNGQSIEDEQQNISTLGAVIANIEGNVQHSKDGEVWVDSTGGESLANLNYIRTLSGGRAIVLFDDGSVARLDGDTELYLSSLQSDALEITLVSGQVYSRVVESENQSFTVVTANEKFKALGTAYKTSTSATKDVIEVYQSKVKVESEDLEVPEGNKYDTETKTQAEIDLVALEADEFAQWNKLKDSENEKFKDKLGVFVTDEDPAPAPAPTGSSNGIFASGSKTDKGITISWSVKGVDTSQGFKVAFSKDDTTPTYGEDSAKFVDAGSSSFTLELTDGKTWHVRVCAYKGDGSCTNYSNTVSIAAPYVELKKVTHGTMSSSLSGDVLSWSYTGNAVYGYKIIWNTSGLPVYPGSDYEYLSSPSASELNLSEKITEAGTYYVRVCAYTSGSEAEKCVDYSPEQTYTVTP